MFLDFTIGLGQLSTCKRLKVGAIIIPQEMTEVLSIGYNGPPVGKDNMGCREASVGSCGCVHAEANALLKLRGRHYGLVMILTRSPCEHCAGLIINSRCIDAIVYIDEYRDRTGLDLLNSVHITTVPARLLELPERNEARLQPLPPPEIGLAD